MNIVEKLGYMVCGMIFYVVIFGYLFVKEKVGCVWVNLGEDLM